MTMTLSPWQCSTAIFVDRQHDIYVLQDEIREFMVGYQGDLYEEPFVDFSTTRNFALRVRTDSAPCLQPLCFSLLRSSYPNTANMADHHPATQPACAGTWGQDGVRIHGGR